MDVEDNDYFNEQLRIDVDSGFLHYRYYLDIDPNHDQQREDAIALVSKLLRHLWAQGYSAVAACNYEDELPNKGKLLSPQPAAA